MLLTWAPTDPIFSAVPTLVASVLALNTCILGLHVPPPHWPGEGMLHPILPSLPGIILPESLPQLLTQNFRLPPETLELLIFEHPEVTPQLCLPRYARF